MTKGADHSGGKYSAIQRILKGMSRDELINQRIQERIKQVRAMIFTGKEKRVEDPELPVRVINGTLSLFEPPKELLDQWAPLIVPVAYADVWYLKRGMVELAGGMFEGAPFPLVDWDEEEWAIFGVEDPFDDGLLIQTDDSGTGVILRLSDRCVYGVNCDIELQKIGKFTDYIEYCLDQIIGGKNWYEEIENSKLLKKYRLAPIKLFD
jgi:hypothetical protein